MTKETTPSTNNPTAAIDDKRKRTDNPGIQPSQLGNFPSLTKSPTQQTTSKTNSQPYSLSFSNTTFGSSASIVGFGVSGSATDSFSDLLKSPIKKRTKQQISDDEDDESVNEESNYTFGEIKDVEPWDSDSLMTGEEEETTLFATRCKLFAWSKIDTTETWKERGVGNLRINISRTDAGCARLVMRADGVLRVILNVRIVAKMPCKLRDEKYVEIIACETVPDFTKFLFKLGSSDAAKQLYDSILEAIPISNITKPSEAIKPKVEKVEKLEKVEEKVEKVEKVEKKLKTEDKSAEKVDPVIETSKK